MDIPYKYHSFSVPRQPRLQLIAQLRQLGQENWELLRSPIIHQEAIWIEARQAPYASPAPWSWEYHFFDVKPAPPGWLEHLQSCGWIRLEPPFHGYEGHYYCLFKRPGTYCGQDDGDVNARLQEMGWSDEDMYRLGLHLLNIKAEILKVKWEQSMLQGRNIGTYGAVRWWLAHFYLPLLLKFTRASVEDLFPGIGDLSREAVLDLLLSRREASRKGADVKTLRRLVADLLAVPLTLKAMRAQVITTCDYQGGSLQHAITLARVLRLLGLETLFINLQPPIDTAAAGLLAASGIELLTTSPSNLPAAELSFVVDLLEQSCCEAARHLVRRNDRLILVPTGYLRDHPLPDFPGKAEALWYVSWDQAVDSRCYWDVARQVEVVHCSVDTERFKPSARKPTGNPWILSRHSRDRAEKFSQEMFYIFNCLGDSFDVRLRMLGAVETLGVIPDSRVECYAQGSLDVADFLRESDVWFFAHAIYWRESACLAMLEAMACGLPVVVTNAGGMREYMRPGETGFLCNDSQEFVRSLRLLLEHPNLYRLMSIQAQRFVEQRHSLRAFASSVGTLLGVSNSFPDEVNMFTGGSRG